MDSPLHDCTILLTREHSQVAALADMLRQRGAMTLACPTITFAPPQDWGPTDRCLDALGSYDSLILTSVKAVTFFFERLRALGRSEADLRGKACYVVGPATAKALASENGPDPVIPCRYQAEGLIALLDSEEVHGRRFLFPRAARAREVLTDYLRRRGAHVDIAVVYETRMAAENTEQLRGILASTPPDYLTFTSTSTVQHFLAMAGASTKVFWTDIPAACIGDITADTARNAGFSTVLAAREATLSGLVQALVDHRTGRQE